MRDRLYEILSQKNQFLHDKEMLIYIKDGQLVVLWNDGESLCEINGDVPNEAFQLLNWINSD